MKGSKEWPRLELQLHRRELRLRHREQHLRRRELRLRHQEKHQQQTRRTPEVVRSSREPGDSDVLDASSDLAKRLFSKGYEAQPPLNGGEASSASLGGDALVWAAGRGLEEEVRLLVQAGANVDYMDTSVAGYRRTALHGAAHGGFCRVVSLLAEAGADLEEEMEEGHTALLYAVDGGQTEAMRLLVDRGASLECRDWSGGGLLHVAARSGNPELVSLICSIGRGVVDVDGRDHGQSTPAHSACAWGDLEALRALVDAGANIHLQDEHYATPLHDAAGRGHATIVVYLLECGADPVAFNRKGYSPLHLAIDARSEAVVRILLRHHVDANLKTGGEGNLKGRTPLSLAAATGSTEVFRALMEHGADPQLLGDQGESPLHLAAASGFTEILQFLLETKATDIELRDTSRDATPLLLAARWRRRDAVRLLAGHGASLDVRDNTGWTPLHWAVHHGDKLLVRYLVGDLAGVDLLEARDDGYGLTVLMMAAVNGDTDMVALLLNSGASTAAKDDEGRTALHHAARNGREAVVEALVDHGADITAETNDGRRPEQLALDAGYEETADLFTGQIPVSKKGLEQSRLQLVATLVAAAASDNVPQPARLLSREGGGGPLISVLDPDGRRALSAAAENGHGDAVEYLIQQGSHIDARDAHGETALWWASRNGHVQVVETLLRREASIEIGDLDDLTPLCAAAHKGHEAVADALLRRSGDSNAVTMYGRTPLMFATLAGNLEMVELLVNNGAQAGYSHPRYGVTASSLLASAAVEGNEKIRFFLEMHETIDFFLQLYDAICQSGDVLQPKKEVATGSLAEVFRLSQPLGGGHVEAVQILIGSGAEINRTNEDDTAALRWAALLGNLEMIRLLHDHGADLNLPDLDGQTVISHAAEAGSADAVQLLVDLGARIEITDTALRTPLWYAVANGRKEVAEVLVANGANLECADDHGRTPLFAAAGDGLWDICDMLLRKGAQITRTDAYARRSPLSLAAQFGHESIVELLIEHGAHLDHAARQGLTPLMLAVRGGAMPWWSGSCSRWGPIPASSTTVVVRPFLTPRSSARRRH
ncbi:hypothetical protein PG996_010902 [Apiospora saccharicola]|uniref:Ankyrin repeat domain-containing protein n=1 Tax=Apiospora saccharicola TaxID=335842 RepID=A0ABR1UPY1_9PEZI